MRRHSRSHETRLRYRDYKVPNQIVLCIVLTRVPPVDRVWLPGCIKPPSVRTTTVRRGVRVKSIYPMAFKQSPNCLKRRAIIPVTAKRTSSVPAKRITISCTAAKRCMMRPVGRHEARGSPSSHRSNCVAVKCAMSENGTMQSTVWLLSIW